jgi:hypothetical protein
MMDKGQIAREAQNLWDNEVFQLALTNMRSVALEGLVRTPATDIEAIRDHQARVRVVDELRSNLGAFIRAGLPRKTPGIV